MENQVLLSIVVPIYNTKKYLDKCLQSILNQSYTNLEIILVDDGSNDGSGEICDRYAQEDSRIVVVHQKNGGQNRARNAGIERATGSYITFVDSDDWIECDLYEEMFKQMTGEYDLVISDFHMDKEDFSYEARTKFSPGNYERKDIENILPGVIWNYVEGCQNISASLCGRFFEANMLRRQMIDLDYSMTLCEDAAILYPYIISAKRMFVTNLCKYHYVQHNASTVHNLSLKSFESVLGFKNFFEKKMDDYEEKNIIDSAMKNCILTQLLQFVSLKLRGIIRDVYEINMTPFRWSVPYSRIPVSRKLIVYGAGGVGRAYYYALKYSVKFDVALWVDKNYLDFEGVSAPEQIKQTEYDYIIIAVSKKEMADEIKSELYAMGVDKERVIWEEPKPISLFYTKNILT